MNEVTDNAGDRIRNATIELIETDGLVGLRISKVAKKAKVSQALIYKYYGDREDLLAQVLGDMMADFYIQGQATVANFLTEVRQPFTIEALVRVLPIPSDETARRHRWLRIQALAASCEIPGLRTRLKLMQTELDKNSEFLSSKIRQSTGAKGDFDVRVFRQLVNAIMFGLILNDISDDPITDDQYVPFITDLMSTYLT